MTFRSRRMARRFGLPPATANNVHINRKLQVPMRDGAVLLGDRFYSAANPDQPVILIRSPYGALQASP